MGIDEWDALPWWQALVYLEGMEREELITMDRGDRGYGGEGSSQLGSQYSFDPFAPL